MNQKSGNVELLKLERTARNKHGNKWFVAVAIGEHIEELSLVADKTQNSSQIAEQIQRCLKFKDLLTLDSLQLM